MKWKNKGHEYDAMYEAIEKLDGFYMFGAGDYGNQFYQIFKDEIKLEGYIDNNSFVQGVRMLPMVSASIELLDGEEFKRIK